jgi:Right handed beta helix region
MEGGSVRQALNSWVYIGGNAGAGTAEFDHVQFTGAANTGLIVSAGSSLTLQRCQISDVAQVGVYVRDRGTEALVSNTTIKDCKGAGLFAQLEGIISAGGCTIEGNARGIQAGNTADDPAHSAAIALTDCTVRGNSIFGLGTWQRGTIKMRGGFLGNNTKDSEKSSGGEIHID